MTASYPIRPAVLEFTPYAPGLSIDEIKERYGLSQVVKMASNENPLGTSPLVQERVCKAAGTMFRYIQSGAPRLVEAVAQFFQVPSACVVLGNGSDEVIDLLIRACPTPGIHNVVTCTPCFSLYTLQSKLCGVALREVPLNPDFSFPWQAMRAAVDESTALVFITTPDNPSGFCPPREEVLAFAASLPPTCLLVVDEAYIDFCENEQESSLLPLLATLPNVVVLRTFSKSFGLAGMRLGFGVMSQKLATCLCAIRPPFSVNILAEVAGITALEDTAFRAATMHTVKTGRAYLQEQLTALGCTVFPSQANFLMFRLPQGCTKQAKEVFASLLERGIIIRPLTSYNLADHLRVTVGTAEENALFVQELAGVLRHA